MGCEYFNTGLPKPLNMISLTCLLRDREGIKIKEQMKKYILLLCAVFSLTTMAQVPIDANLSKSKQDNITQLHTRAKVASTQLLDSIVTKTNLGINHEKKEYAYNKNGNVTMEAYYSWVSEKWKGNSMYEYAYDSNENITLKVCYKNDKNSWGKSEKYEYAYDSNGNKTSEIYYYWNNAWIASLNSEYSYDNSGNITLEIHRYWNIDFNSWVGSMNTESVYDSNGNITKTIFYEWDSELNNWAINNVSEYTCDSNGNITLRILYVEDYESDGLVEYSKHEYAYDSNGNKILDALYYWNSESNIWVEYRKNEHRHEYTYNNDVYLNEDLYGFLNENRFESLIKHTYYTRNSFSNNWVAEEESSYYYNNNKLQALHTKKWNNETNSWEEGEWFEYTYDNDENITSETEFYWSVRYKQWFILITTNYHYSANTSTDLTTSAIMNTKVFFNTTSGIAIIETPNGKTPHVRVFDIQGMLLQSEYTNQINLNGYSKGIYLFNIDGVTQKLMKR